MGTVIQDDVSSSLPTSTSTVTPSSQFGNYTGISSHSTDNNKIVQGHSVQDILINPRSRSSSAVIINTSLSSSPVASPIGHPSNTSVIRDDSSIEVKDVKNSVTSSTSNSNNATTTSNGWNASSRTSSVPVSSVATNKSSSSSQSTTTTTGSSTENSGLSSNSTSAVTSTLPYDHYGASQPFPSPMFSLPLSKHHKPSSTTSHSNNNGNHSTVTTNETSNTTTSPMRLVSRLTQRVTSADSR